MEVNPGYKHSEVGVFPADWELKTLGSLTVLLTNGFVGTATNAYVDDDDGVLYIQGYNVEENGFNFHGIKRVSKSFHSRNKKSCLQFGDLLTIQTGDIGVTAVVPLELAGSNCHALIISRLDRQVSEPSFYCQYFNADQGRAAFKQVETGTTMKHLNCGDLRRLLLPSPPVKEQRAIATALSNVDALLAALDRLIAKKRNVKQAAMQQLLTGQTRLPGFTDNWDVKPLGSEIADLESGVSVNSVEDDIENGFGRLAILKTSAVTNGRFIPSESKTIAVRDLKRAKLSPKAESVIISRMNTIDLVGECGYVPADFPNLFVPDRLWMTRFKASSQVSAKWLAFVLSTPLSRRLLKSIATGTSGSMKNIAKGKFLALEFDFPHPDEQTAIAEVLTDMDAELAALEQRLAKTRAIKQAMMQELLTGRTRLVSLQVTHA
jgi:type I restriction enzyme, S subunit